MATYDLGSVIGPQGPKGDDSGAEMYAQLAREYSQGASLASSGAQAFCESAQAAAEQAGLSAKEAEASAEMFNNAVSVTDWNNAVKPGFYFSEANAENAPVFINNNFKLYGFVSSYNGQIKQMVTQQYGTHFRIRDSSTSGFMPWKDPLPLATEETSGLMSGDDKWKLDNIADNMDHVKSMTPEEYEAAVKDPETYYIVG